MRVNSIMPQMRATSIKRNDNVNSSNQTMPVAMNLTAPIVKSGVILTFTGMIVKTFINSYHMLQKTKDLE